MKRTVSGGTVIFDWPSDYLSSAAACSWITMFVEGLDGRRLLKDGKKSEDVAVREFFDLSPCSAFIVAEKEVTGSRPLGLPYDVTLDQEF